MESTTVLQPRRNRVLILISTLSVLLIANLTAAQPVLRSVRMQGHVNWPPGFSARNGCQLAAIPHLPMSAFAADRRGSMAEVGP
jgi:hypothetical protein